MKVLHVIPSLSLKHGGPSVALPLIASALTQAGIAVTITTTDDDGPGARLNVPIGEKVLTDYGAELFYFRKNTEFYKFSQGLGRWLRERVSEFDLVHIHALFSHSSTTAARSALHRGVPYIIRPLGVLNRWGIENRRRLLKQVSLRLIELPLLRRAAAIHFTSAAERNEAVAIDESLEATRSEIIPLPIRKEIAEGDSNRFFRRFPQAQGRPLILYLSRIDPKKGVDLLLRAFALARRQRPDALLVIAGAGDRDYMDALRGQSDDADLGPNVVWTGFLEGDDKSAAFAAATMFVLPSYSENFGVAAAEALMAGAATIVTEQVGIAEEILRAEAGWVVASDAMALSDAMVKLLNERETRERLGKRGRMLAENRFSEEVVGRALVQLYDSILTGNAKPVARPI